MLQVVEEADVSDSPGGYTAPVPATALGRRIRQLRGERTLKQIDRKARLGISKLSKLERGEDDNPTLDTLRSVARGLERPLASLFINEPRPEEQPGDERVTDSAILDRFISAFAGDAPQEATWRADVLTAIAALTRALQRPRGAGEITEPPEAPGPRAASDR